MAETVPGWFDIFGINQINSVMGVGPGIEQTFTRENLADIFGGAGIVDDGVAFPGEANTDDQVSVWPASFAAQAVVADGKADRQASGDPILEFRNVTQTAYV